ncbi:MAG: hypothetical protein CSA96_06665 [Bacteroidetes bacterium]|nr:MAG: hypothetical protein CSA96_06665 [Bacteroidota bacterium]
MQRNKGPVILSLLALLLLAACVPNRKVMYVQETKEMLAQQEDNMYFIDQNMDNKIRQGDEIYIRVTSDDETQTNFSQQANQNVHDPSLLSHTVDDGGFIKLPYINRTKVSGLTLLEASDLIEAELSQYLLNPSVFIRFVNNKVTILGEVNRPGVYVFNYKSVNILQAIGYAGDIAVFGDRNHVLIVREEGEYRSKYEIDLTRDDLLTSELYMVKSNDIIYVKPLNSKKWGLDVFPYDLLLSIASLSIVVMTFMINYVR